MVTARTTRSATRLGKAKSQDDDESSESEDDDETGYKTRAARKNRSKRGPGRPKRNPPQPKRGRGRPKRSRFIVPSGEESLSSETEDDSDKPRLRRRVQSPNRRSKRLRGTRETRSYAVQQIESSEGEDEDSDAYSSQSNGPPRKRKRRGRQQRYSSEPQVAVGTRRSGRSTRAVNMKEREVDDIYLSGSETLPTAKVYGVRENVQRSRRGATLFAIATVKTATLCRENTGSSNPEPAGVLSRMLLCVSQELLGSSWQP